MNTLRKFFVLLLVLLLSLPIASLAHSGRTDSKGGHYNRSTGEYHFHHGYPAHQHTNGQCPYNFDDKTGSSSGSSSRKKSSPTATPRPVRATATPAPAAFSGSSSSSAALLAAGAGGAGVFAVGRSLLHNRKRRK